MSKKAINMSKIIKLGIDKKKLGTTADIENQTVMLRDFIHDRLYQ